MKKKISDTQVFKSIIRQSKNILSYIDSYLKKNTSKILYDPSYIPPIKADQIHNIIFTFPELEENEENLAKPYLEVKLFTCTKDDLTIPASPISAFTINQLFEFKIFLEDKIKYYTSL